MLPARNRDTITRRFAPSSGRQTTHPLLAVGLAVLACLLLSVGVLGAMRLARPGALPGTTVSGVDVGGLQGPALVAAIEAAGEGDSRISIRRGSTEVSHDGATFGYESDVEATMDAVLERGRQPNPLRAFGDHFQAFTTTTPVALVARVDQAALTASVEEAAEALTLEPVEADLEIDGVTLTRIEPQPGALVRIEPLEVAVRAALLDDGPTVIEAQTDPVTPITSLEALDDVAAAAARAVSAPVVLHRNETRLELSPEQIGGVLEVDRADGTLMLAADPEALAGLVPDEVAAALGTEPVNARIEVNGGVVSIIESAPGFRFDVTAAAGQVLTLATGEGERSAELSGVVAEAELTTEDAVALGVTEQVSAFTTEFPCCQSRVTNIHRIADLVDGVLILPGETFSLNDHVGPRTREKGFVDGGAIQQGEFVQEVGGGVSQFTTTIYNAAFFGGYELVDYKAHSYYISRYPPGREATLNFPTVDFKVRNSSPHGLVMKAGYTGTSITVAFYGTKWVTVTDITGEAREPTEPETEFRENAGLPRGGSRVVQSGRGGFDITVIRVLAYPDGREEREEYFTRYLPEPRIVERNSGTPPPAEPSPEPEPEPEPDPDPDPEPTTPPPPSDTPTEPAPEPTPTPTAG